MKLELLFGLKEDDIYISRNQSKILIVEKEFKQPLKTFLLSLGFKFYQRFGFKEARMTGLKVKKMLENK